MSSSRDSPAGPGRNPVQMSATIVTDVDSGVPAAEWPDVGWEEVAPADRETALARLAGTGAARSVRGPARARTVLSIEPPAWARADGHDPMDDPDGLYRITCGAPGLATGLVARLAADAALRGSSVDAVIAEARAYAATAHLLLVPAWIDPAARRASLIQVAATGRRIVSCHHGRWESERRRGRRGMLASAVDVVERTMRGRHVARAAVGHSGSAAAVDHLLDAVERRQPDLAVDLVGIVTEPFRGLVGGHCVALAWVEAAAPASADAGS